jgi:hypothetical protein
LHSAKVRLAAALGEEEIGHGTHIPGRRGEVEDVPQRLEHPASGVPRSDGAAAPRQCVRRLAAARRNRGIILAQRCVEVVGPNIVLLLFLMHIGAL